MVEIRCSNCHLLCYTVVDKGKEFTPKANDYIRVDSRLPKPKGGYKFKCPECSYQWVYAVNGGVRPVWHSNDHPVAVLATVAEAIQIERDYYAS